MTLLWSFYTVFPISDDWTGGVIASSDGSLAQALSCLAALAVSMPTQTDRPDQKNHLNPLQKQTHAAS